MNEIKNYAKFRRELKETCPWLGEQEIYKKWRLLVDGPEWQTHQVPTKGCDGRYHYVYITIVVPTGEIYVGRHSRDNMNDNYHGSGDKIRELEAQGVELITTPLEFFRSYKMSLVAEGEIVDRSFLIEPGVLNKVPGGDDTRRNEPADAAPTSSAAPEVEESTVETPFGDIVSVPVVKGSPKVVEAPKVVVKKYAPAKGSSNFCSFANLEIPVGGILEYALDTSITAEVVDSDRNVKCKGVVKTLTTTTLNLTGKKYEKGFQPLNYWRYNGEPLIEIREKVLKKSKCGI